jgi:hypothetical protein
MAEPTKDELMARSPSSKSNSWERRTGSWSSRFRRHATERVTSQVAMIRAQSLKARCAVLDSYLRPCYSDLCSGMK